MGKIYKNVKIKYIFLFIFFYSQICIGQGYNFSRKKIVLNEIDSTECIVFINGNAVVYIEKQALIDELSEINWASNRHEFDTIISKINRPGKLYIPLKSVPNKNRNSNLDEMITEDFENISLITNIFLTQELLKGNCIVLKRNKKLKETKIVIAKVKKPGTIEFYFPHCGKMIHSETFALD